MFKCIVVDDEDLARELIASHVDKLDDFEIIGACSSALEARKLLQDEQVDLLFLDIEMPVLKGTDFLKGIRNPPRVIFTTAYRDYAVEGFELSAVDYLLKPIVFERFFQAIEKFTSLHQGTISTFSEDRMAHIYVSSNKKKIKLLLDEVHYIESIKDYIKIHLTEGELVIKNGITAFLEELDSRFLRIHRSFVINKDKITSYSKTDVELDKVELPIGEFYKNQVLKSIE